MQNSKEYLIELAKELLKEKGLEPDFSHAAIDQAQETHEPTSWPDRYQDLRDLVWCSIDNDDSLDLDQLTYAKKEADTIHLYVAIADVDILVSKNSPIDKHAQINTTSIYTPGQIFPMLPLKLSTDLTSLNEGVDRAAIVFQIVVTPSGTIQKSFIYEAIVHNKAKLTYSLIGGWLNENNPLPNKAKQVPGLEEALIIQHEAAQELKTRRHERGALTLESAEAIAKMDNQTIQLTLSSHNYAHQLIEEFMIAANSCLVDHLKEAKIPSLRRIVRIPKRWDRIRELAVEYGESLPLVPDPKALDQFLTSRQKADPESFPDLSLSVIKLLGNGEYVVENPNDPPIGHFGLAKKNYTHATAPNRRYPDLISQRQYKAFLARAESPYTLKELEFLAEHCTAQEDSATKVERQVNKSAAAILLSSSIGKTFTGIITGAGEKGTWIRILEPPVEGKVVRNTQNLDIGDKVKVKLISVNVERGFIDFVPT